MRRASMMALIDATMSDLRYQDSDPGARTVLADLSDDMNDEMTEVNLDLNGALEAVVEAETRVARPAARRASLEYTKIELNSPPPSKPSSPLSWIEDLIVAEEFAFTEDEELPLLDSGEFVAVPRTDDLRIPSAVKLNSRLLIAPEPKPLRVARIHPDLVLPKVVDGTPFIPVFERVSLTALPPPASTWPWISAIAFWAVTILGAWAYRMQLFELLGLL